jgi:hypothetical protein
MEIWKTLRVSHIPTLVFAERVGSDEAKEAFRAFFAKRKPAYHPQ